MNVLAAAEARLDHEAEMELAEAAQAGVNEGVSVPETESLHPYLPLMRRKCPEANSKKTD